MLTNLSELLRRTLAVWETQEVPLQIEIEFINLYLDIQRVRFQDRLTVEMSLSPVTLSALVPSLLLQPLVENAIRHGVSKTNAPVRSPASCDEFSFKAVNRRVDVIRDRGGAVDLFLTNR